MLSLAGVSYRYPGATHDALHGVSLSLREGSVTGLVGPTGAGKSSLCLVAGGVAPRVVGGRLIGTVGVDGEGIADWPMHRVCEAVVTGIQEPAGQLSLIADTVFTEVAFGPANLGLPQDEVVARTSRALAQMGIEGLAGRDPGRLSGGQQQLVVLAGLLAMEARHLVLDEPLAHLDARGAAAVLAAVRAAADGGAAVLIAEQRIDELEPVCDSLAVIAGGNIVRVGLPEEVLDDPAVAALGVDTARSRLRRSLAEAGLDTAVLVGT